MKKLVIRPLYNNLCKYSVNIRMFSPDIHRLKKAHLSHPSIDFYNSGVQLRHGAPRHLRHHRSHLGLLLCDLLHDDVCQRPPTKTTRKQTF